MWPLLDLRPQVKADSFMRPRTGDDGRMRFHAGMDLPAPRGTIVVAPESGTIVRTQTFNGAHAHALLLETTSGLVINLGEVEPGSWSEFGVGPGSAVFQGQAVARVGVNPGGSEMLHVETYVPGTRRTARWYQDEGPPPSLLDPTDYILRAALRPMTSKGKAPGAPVHVPRPPAPPAAPPNPGPSPAPSSAAGVGVAGLVVLVLLYLARRGRRADR